MWFTNNKFCTIISFFSTEPSLLEEEIKCVLEKSSNNKTTGADKITTEAIRVFQEIGVTWLTTIFNQAWSERKVPHERQRAMVVAIWKNKGNIKNVTHIEAFLSSVK